jgi:hypothetical protein
MGTTVPVLAIRYTSAFMIQITYVVIPGRGRQAESPESSNHRKWILVSGLAPTRRPGMTP